MVALQDCAPKRVEGRSARAVGLLTVRVLIGLGFVQLARGLIYATQFLFRLALNTRLTGGGALSVRVVLTATRPVVWVARWMVRIGIHVSGWKHWGRMDALASGCLYVETNTVGR